ncbi:MULTISPECIES: SH3 domain-containing protein [Luteimonas]|uniref:NlpC-P60 family protein n=1 Tax=Luteimonas chenhongjianii TaxID=2006110 RepID=A0A290XDW5_9GAMM|nr:MULTISPECIES: SH3 domain-containing protein [Luteimonas]ATD67335.1 NlpC-P60 family protein [Luteimonas chenhongjianii]RPD86570.1 NlpC-P60 family protein [Luteimonas sp. 100069]
MRSIHRPSSLRAAFHALVMAAALLGTSSAVASASIAAIPGLDRAMLSPAFWVARQPAADAVVLDAAAIEALNARMRREDASIHTPLALPDHLDGHMVRTWIEAVSKRPTQPRFTTAGRIDDAALDAWMDALALDEIPAGVALRFGLVVRRADLRAFPTATRVFSEPGDTDIDRFQEDALFPGTPVAVMHTSRDGEWLFVESERYRAWIRASLVALGSRAAVADFAARAARGPIVTGATARTVFTPEAPEVSDVQLEMGVRLPRVNPDGATALHGQVPGFGRVIELPVREHDGALSFSPALIPAAADMADDALPHTRATLLRQAFKFLGERYGWGHGYNARDCSGFVSEVYRSVGILLPRNTGAQATSPALDRIEVAPDMPRSQRLQLLREADVGDLVFMPGHVMMVIGHVGGEPWVIHDTAGMSVRTAGGAVTPLPLNGVVVTPVTPMLAGDRGSVVDRMTAIQRVR